MRFAAYAGTSMVLATGVIIRALHQRANFYSACVYLAQSNACLMVITNVALLGVCTAMFGLQKLFYGPLRPIEVEQLYEKAWFAITETCLAMTIFREEVGGWFLVMFVCLLIGKVWGWIGEGRVEVLEQQPPPNPRLFHARLSVSLIISTLFNISMLRYSINTVLLHARPNMMVMFAFEFAVLTVTSLSTAARYTISLHEASVTSNQIKDRRAQMRRDREHARSHAPSTDSSTPPGTHTEDAAPEDDIDSLDIDVPGWEEKGRWVFYLDLTTDFFKLVLYLTFFCVLCMFYGMPIHIIRDVVLTIRSFYKRITDFVRYRQATRDMNAKYPDATVEEVAREDVCIICREDMRSWQQSATPGVQRTDNAGTTPTAPTAVDERLRPKKLPCGHILHFACLRSWLERQQNCPTCRRPVLVSGVVVRTREQELANQHGRAQPNLNQRQIPIPPDGNLQPPGAPQNVFNLGPIRIAFGARQVLPQQMNNNNNNNNAPPNQQGAVPAATAMPRISSTVGFQRQAPGIPARTIANFSPTSLQLQLHQIEQQLVREINGLRVQQNQLYLVRALQGELARLRIAQAHPETILSGPSATVNQHRSLDTLPQTMSSEPNFGVVSPQQGIGSGHHNLPAGMTLPPGWTMLPLQRLSDGRGTNVGIMNNPPTFNVQSQMNGGNFPAGSVPLDNAALNHPYDSQANTFPSEGSSSKQSRLKSSETSTSIEDSKRPSTQLLASAGGQSSVPATSLNTQTTAGDSTQNSSGDGSSSSHYSPPELPLWGSSSGGMNGHEEDITVEKPILEKFINDDARPTNDPYPSQSLSDSGQSKGKGRAMTVEDSVEDAD